MALGRKTGGRPKGARNKLTRETLDAAAAAGEKPLDYMLRVMNDKKAKVERRDEMARSAAPYVHPRLSSVEHGGKGGGPIQGQIKIVLVDPEKKK